MGKIVQFLGKKISKYSEGLDNCSKCDKVLSGKWDDAQSFLIEHQFAPYSDGESKYDGMMLRMRLCNKCLNEWCDEIAKTYYNNPISDNGLL